MGSKTPGESISDCVDPRSHRPSRACERRRLGGRSWTGAQLVVSLLVLLFGVTVSFCLRAPKECVLAPRTVTPSELVARLSSQMSFANVMIYLSNIAGPYAFNGDMTVVHDDSQLHVLSQ